MIEVNIIADSISPSKKRLTTFLVTYPRFIHSEIMTHRTFCLDGDTELYFDLPVAIAKGETQRMSIKLKDLYKKWTEGSALRPHKKKEWNISLIDPARHYTVRELTDILNYSHYTAVNNFLRLHKIPRSGPNNRYILGQDLITYHNLHKDKRSPYSLRSRLEAMHLRSCNEETGEIIYTHLKDIWASGEKPVYRLKLTDGKEIISSADHLFLTLNGWQRLEDAIGLQLSPGGVATWRHKASFSVNGVPAYKDKAWLQAQKDLGLSASMIALASGASVDQVKRQFKKHGVKNTQPLLVWKNSHTKAPWNKGLNYSNLTTRGVPNKAKIRKGADSHFWKGGVTSERKLIGAWTQNAAFTVHRQNRHCILCPSAKKLHTHHIDPVWHNPERAKDITNLTSLCSDCHRRIHGRNLDIVLLNYLDKKLPSQEFWASIGEVVMPVEHKTAKGSRYTMIRKYAEIESIEYVGIRPTYDVEVTGPYHNFVANGLIVHNSRNASSSRAVPIKKMLAAVANNPVVPASWGKNKAGMQASENLPVSVAARATEVWLRAAKAAVEHVEELLDLGVHKQISNRLLEPFNHMTTLISSTEWENFFALRAHPDAQPEFQELAYAMLEAYLASSPKPLQAGEWHIPYGDRVPDEMSLADRLKIATARCARTSYIAFDKEGKDLDISKDLDLHDRLASSGHWSPFEHIAEALPDASPSGNFMGWRQYRKGFSEENKSCDLTTLYISHITNQSESSG